MKRIVYILFVLLFVSCANPKSQKSDVELNLTVPQAPSLITEYAEKLDYVTSHFWDNFLSNSEAPCDSARILGVKCEEVEQGVSSYLTLLYELPVEKAQKKLASLFKKIEKTQAVATHEVFFLQFTDLLVKYLYDPNSPLRSEDLYTPFVQGLVSSEYTESSKRSGYAFELEKCLLNPYGAVAPDFEFKDIKGRSYTLHGEKAEYTLLFFSNPGCNACLEIINELGTRPYLETLIKEKSLSVINIYIDDEMDKWRDYVSTYPTSWLNCYDNKKQIKDDLYYVRAIPSLYLLDKEKRIIYKDAPVERVLAYLDNYINNR